MPFFRRQHAGAVPATSLAADPGPAGTAIILVSATGWPDGSVGPFTATMSRGNADEEQVLVTSRSGTTLNVLLADRGWNGTSAAAHAAGTKIEHTFGADEADEANIAVVKTIGAIATKGDLLVADAANSLDNLPVGADGQQLTGDSTAPLGVSWKTPSVTAGEVVGNTAKGDILAATAPDSLVPLAVGSDGQVLTAHAADLTGLRWSTPTVVTSLALSAISTIGSKGEILVDLGGTIGEAPVGTDGQYLTARAAAASGLQWVPLPTSGVIASQAVNPSSSASTAIGAGGSFGSITPTPASLTLVRVPIVIPPSGLIVVEWDAALNPGGGLSTDLVWLGFMYATGNVTSGPSWSAAHFRVSPAPLGTTTEVGVSYRQVVAASELSHAAGDTVTIWPAAVANTTSGSPSLIWGGVGGTHPRGAFSTVVTAA